MEELIKLFLTGNGYGYGYGYGDGDGDGDGYGDGNGNGNGDGYGYGNGNGNGDGYGNGYGDGNGNGNGYGDGNGNGDGDGDGYGNGYGDGDGNGNGDGDGDGDGYGDGNGNGDGYGIKLTTYKGFKVYYIDGIPCYFTSIKKGAPFAQVMVINTSTLAATPQFVFKFNGCFAHGYTLKEAKAEAENKYYAQLDVVERISAFNKTFKRGIEYEARVFFEWHTTLTGSCDAGKRLWVSQNGIDLESKMTVEQFIALTKNSYGGEVIRQLISE